MYSRLPEPRPEYIDRIVASRSGFGKGQSGEIERSCDLEIGLRGMGISQSSFVLRTTFNGNRHGALQ
jgi:hypothetical protein